MKDKIWKRGNISPLICAGMIALAAAATTSCSKNYGQTPYEVQTLVFSVSPMTKAAINYPIEDYFGADGSLFVQVVADTKTSRYIYDGGTLEYYDGDPIAFQSESHALADVNVSWPYDYIFGADQSTKAGFLASDLLICRFTDLMPSIMVPVEFSHANYKLTFTMGGTNEGRRIGSLSVYDSSDTYRAFCDPDTDDAQLMLTTDRNLGGAYGYLTFDDDGTPQVFSIESYTAPAAGTLNQNITVTITL